MDWRWGWSDTMTSLQERNSSYRILFKYLGKLRSFTLGKVSPDEADATGGRLDGCRTIRLSSGVNGVQ
jgi:hypothetical protein